MSNNNDFQQYGFDHYDQVPLNQRKGLMERMFGLRGAVLARSPLVATAAFLLVGAAFAGIIIASYPGEDDVAIPVVKADRFAYKQMPSEPGGMDIANQDSTIYMSMRDEIVAESAPIENLLASEEGQSPEDQIEAFTRQVEDVATVRSGEDAVPVLVPKSPVEKRVENLLDGVQERVVEQVSDRAADVDVGLVSPEPARKVIMHQAGSNPETLAFVRSVLDKKDGRAVAAAQATRLHVAPEIVAKDMAAVRPAAGSQTAAGISAGRHYVQLGSVTNAGGAEGEWGKLQKAFPAQLRGLDHRIQSANLGARGTYYRIQAGPMSKDSAATLCDAIKAQKPGGCLVTK